jgi:hypothetical protein
MALVPQIVAGAGTVSVAPMSAAFPVWVALLPLVAYLPGGALYVLDALYVGRYLNAASVQPPEAAIMPR